MSDGVSAPDTALAAVPIVIGVTGHRDIPAHSHERLRRRFREILNRFASRYPHSPQVLLSALAEGADALAAQEALALGIPVVACLPLPQEEYERDFSADGLSVFRGLLARCAQATVVGRSHNREKAYAEAGAYIAYYSAIVVAFWDGDKSRGYGGTAEVVHMRQHGAVFRPQRDPRLMTYVPDAGPVFQIVTPRSKGNLSHNAYSTSEIWPKRGDVRSEKTEFERALSNLHRYNIDMRAERPGDAATVLEAFRLRTDAAANKLQALAQFWLSVMYAFAFLAASAELVVRPPLGAQHTGFELFRFGLIAIALICFIFAKHKDFENRYQDYRALAEALRIQTAWYCAGLRDRFVEASYLHMQENELQWIRLALRALYIVSGLSTPAVTEASENGEPLKWIRGQLRYYRHSAREEERSKRIVHAMGAALAIVGITASAIALLLKVLNVHGLQGDGLDYAIAMPAAYGGVLALLVTAYGEQRGFSENARRYQHMHALFEAANRKLQAGRPAFDVRILEEIGNEALWEQADWLILHRERPLHFVVH